MFWSTPKPEPVQASTIFTDCNWCGNDSTHRLYRVKHGWGFGNPLTGRRWVSTKTQWLLRCDVCEEFAEISSSDAGLLRNGGGGIGVGSRG